MDEESTTPAFAYEVQIRGTYHYDTLVCNTENTVDEEKDVTAAGIMLMIGGAKISQLPNFAKPLSGPGEG